MNHAANQQQKGFTLIELMLAMTFISILLIAIAMTIIQVGALYNKGMTLRETNQAARDIVSDIQRTVISSTEFSIDDDYIVNDSEGIGRICLGSYSYIWNLGRTTPSLTVKYVNPAKRGERINIVKVPDQAKQYCAKNASGGLAQKDILDVDTNKTKELLPTGDHTLVIHKFALAAGAAGTKSDIIRQQLYELQFSVGTGNLTALTPDQSQCLPPSDVNSDINYCSVQDFTLVVRAGNGVN